MGPNICFLGMFFSFLRIILFGGGGNSISDFEESDDVSDVCFLGGTY